MILPYFLAFLGCGTDPEGNFLDDVATETCDRAQECDPEAFDAEWDSSAVCIDKALVVATCIGECSTGFDASQAEDGVQAVRDAECNTPGSMMFDAFHIAYESGDLECTVEDCYDDMKEFGW
jgi:hypothetical protein